MISSTMGTLLHRQLHYSTWDMIQRFRAVSTRAKSQTGFQWLGNCLKFYQTVDMLVHSRMARAGCEIMLQIHPGFHGKEFLLGEFDDPPQRSVDMSLSKCGNRIERAKTFSPENFQISYKTPGYLGSIL